MRSNSKLFFFEPNIRPLSYKHADVFCNAPFEGNSLTVFVVDEFPPDEIMLKLTQEMKHYESIFLKRITSCNEFFARIFTKQEELEFAGHPIIGAAASLHDWLVPWFTQKKTWIFHLPKKCVAVQSFRDDNRYVATMNQGQPIWSKPLTQTEYLPILKHLNLEESSLAPNLPIMTVSTGFPYLIVPLNSNLESAKIISEGLDYLLPLYGAKEIYLLDVINREGRNWDNHVGTTEDIATGSAAGVAGAYLIKHGLANSNEELIISQGRFTGKPSQMKVKVHSANDTITEVMVSGSVTIIASGSLSEHLNWRKTSFHAT